MTNILADRIQNVSLTKTQQKIADYFIRNQARIGALSSIVAAQEIGVSDASIIRFSRAIGYEGFSDLKDHIYNTLVEDAYSSLTLTQRMAESNEKYPDADMSDQFMQLMRNNVESCFRENSLESFQKIAHHLCTARTCFVVGLRGCRGLAIDFRRLISFMRGNVINLTDGECASISSMQDATEDDVVVLFLAARYYKIDLDYIKMAKERGATVCLVTDHRFSPLSSYADHVVTAATQHMSFFNSTLGFKLIGDYLLTLVSRQLDFKERIAERDEVTRDQLLQI